MAARSACAEADPDAMIAAICARSAPVSAISVWKAQPKPWQMTTREGLGAESDHSLNMAATAGSAVSASAPPAAVNNATSTIAK
jgi:hypothetical protein